MIGKEREFGNLVLSLLDYNESTGHFYWKESAPGRSLKRAAGSVRTDGYRRICIDGVHIYAHRLVYLIKHGELPDFVDHINGNRDDNRDCNLRAATFAQNIQNSVSRGACEYKGVCYYKDRDKYRASIKAGGEYRHLGMYDSAEDAARAYNDAAWAEYGEYARINNVTP